jgi:hypothetical protein
MSSTGGATEMAVLRIEHPVPDFDSWKQAFDSDPVDRRGSGVRRYRVLRSLDDPTRVTVDLEFETTAEADAMRESLHRLWGRVEAEGLIGAQTVTVLESISSEEY